jgi:hypothetical protein
MKGNGSRLTLQYINEIQIEYKQELLSWNSSHATSHGLIRRWHHDEDRASIVEARVGNPAAQLTPLLAEGTRVTEVVSHKVTGYL